jgi:hypothetical protein
MTESIICCISVVTSDIAGFGGGKTRAAGDAGTESHSNAASPFWARQDFAKQSSVPGRLSAQGRRAVVIWESILLMSAIDVAIIGLVGYSVMRFALGPRSAVGFESKIGFAGIAGGLAALALFYVAELLSMTVLPWFIPKAEAMAFMTELHHNHS